MLDSHTTVARVVLDHSECAPVFQRHRIDYCCKGDRSISEVCVERGLDQTTLLAELGRAIAERRDGDGDEHGPDPATLPTPALIAYIIAKHHGYLRRALPFVRALASKVSRVHGDRDPRLTELDAIVAGIADTLEPHLDAEEQVLFPALSIQADPALIASELSTMHADHLVVGAMLDRMRTVTDDYQLPEWACNSYRTLFAELAQLEGDVLRHVHLENHALMPRFVPS